jgi:putative DNA methylase
VLFAQLVDDPSAHRDRFPTEEAQAKERQRLFDLIERLVVWENAGDEDLLRQAYNEIAGCFGGYPPAVFDPFAGGGSIPIEAQRLGLRAVAADLNPVAVLINKALVEIPARWVNRAPVFPNVAESKLGDWPGVAGLAEDVRSYGGWIRDEAERSLRGIYPMATLPGGLSVPVVGWLWARTVRCPNPACGADTPLVRSFWLSKRKDRCAWIRPVVHGNTVEFHVDDDPRGPAVERTVGRQGATCLICQTPFPLKYIRAEAQADRMEQRLLAVIAEGDRRRVYLPPSQPDFAAAAVPRPANAPEAELPAHALGFRVQAYGMTRWADLFTARQLQTLETFGELLAEARERITADAERALPPRVSKDYANDLSVLLALAVSRYTDLLNSICSWNITNQNVTHLFTRQAVPMSWDFVETNPLGPIGVATSFGSVANSLIRLHPTTGRAIQLDSRELQLPAEAVVCTDPPYYDNIGYADLSDFFYVWLRRFLGDLFPDLLGTMLTPKAAELVAAPYRFGGSREKAEHFFESGFVRTFTRIRDAHPRDVPITLFYAFKQAESDDSGVASTGWETVLSGLLQAGLTVTATWPMSTERSGRMRDIGSNALASSIVLACRPREDGAGITDRRGFLTLLREELPRRLRELQQGNIAPVDLAQAAIGPGMAVFSRHRQVTEPDGSAMRVRTALQLINQVLDEVLAEQEGDFDTDSRWCVKWFKQTEWAAGEYGRAETLATALNTSIPGLERAGVLRARAGKVQLLRPSELPESYDPAKDARPTMWEAVLHLSKRLEKYGPESAGQLMRQLQSVMDLNGVKELAYLLYSVCDRKRRQESALVFNNLVTSWPEIADAAQNAPGMVDYQQAMDFTEE